MKITLFKSAPKLFILAIICTLSFFCRAQGNSHFQPFAPHVQATPTAHMYDRHTFYPASPATGIPDISVPLYAVTVKNFSLPIELKYHSGGIKYRTDVPYPIGYGWQMFPALRVTRQLNGGKADELFLLSPEKIQAAHNDLRGGVAVLSNANNLDKLKNIADMGSNHSQSVDTDYDIFTLSLPHTSAAFILQRNNSTNQLSCLPINNSFLKISILKSNLHGICAFEVIDEHGVKYYFGDSTSPNNFVQNTYIESCDGVALGWMLNKITLPTTEEITFNYAQYTLRPPYMSFGNWKDGVSYIISSSENLGHTGPFQEPAGINQMLRHSFPNYALLLTKIEFPFGKVDFTYTAGTAEGAMLNKVEVFNKSNQSVFLANLYRLATEPYFLSSVQVRGQSPYSFEYDMNQRFAENDLVDYWGYFNGKSTSVPRIPIRIFERNITIGNVSNIMPNFTYAKAGILNKVTFPTGGHTSFEYEMNRTSSSTLVGGMRIKKMTVYDPISNKNVIKEYKYGLNESGNGITAIVPGVIDYYHTTYSYYSDNKIINGGFGNPLVVPVWDVRKYVYSWGENKARDLFQTYLPIFYEYITEYTGEGKTVYRYSYSYDSFYLSANLNFAVNYSISRYRNQPLLREKKVYNQSGQILRTENYEYQLMFTSTVKGVVAKPFYDWGSIDEIRADILSPHIDFGTPLCHYNEYDIQLGEYKLTSHTVKEYIFR